MLYVFYAHLACSLLCLNLVSVVLVLPSLHSSAVLEKFFTCMYRDVCMYLFYKHILMLSLYFFSVSFAKSFDKEFIIHVCQRWVPFLERLEELYTGERRKLVENYLVNLSHVS